MISSADVGIGIQGVEGTQATRASDYAIGQFSFLLRLLFIHGRESYRKNSFAVIYMLWKNFLYILPNVIFGFSTQFSAVNLYDPYIDILYNLLFTQFAIGWYSVADKEFQYKFLQKSPYLYKPGLHNKYFNKVIFWKWYLYALFLAFILYWIATSVFINSVGSNNESSDLSVLGSTIYFNIVFYVNLKLILTTHSYEFISIGIQLGSIAAYVIVLYFTSKFTLFITFGNWEFLKQSTSFIFQTFLVLLIGVLMEYAFRSLNFFLYELFVKSHLRHTETLQNRETRGMSIISTEKNLKYKDDDDLMSEKIDKEELANEDDESDSLGFEDDDNNLEDVDSRKSSDNIKIIDNKIYYKNELFNTDDLNDEGSPSFISNEDKKDYLERKSYMGFAYVSDNPGVKMIKRNFSSIG